MKEAIVTFSVEPNGANASMHGGCQQNESNWSTSGAGHKESGSNSALIYQNQP